MKRMFTIFATILLTASVFAQSPEKMSYQAVIRNSSDQLVTNQSIGMQISILQGSLTSSGSPVYVETQTPTSNDNGLVSIEIGAGSIVSGNFATIDWSTGTYFIKTETDPTGGTNYTISGTSQLLSVPYALHAKTVASYTETDPTVKAINGIVKSDGTTISAATAGTDYLTPKGSAESLTNFPILNQNTTGNAATVTTNANLSGPIKSKGNTTSVTSQTGTGSTFVMNTSPTLINPNLGTPTVLVGTKITGTAAGLTVGHVTTNANLTGDVTSTGNATIIAHKKTMTAAAPVSITGSPTVIASSAVAISIAEATPSAAGSMSASDKTKLDGIAIPVHNIGESYGGGIIFYLDASGQHGLIAATEDQSTGIQWYNGTYRFTGTTGDGLYAGAMNTAILVATQIADTKTGNFAAKVCADYSVTVGGVTYGDWYLPSKYELILLYAQKAVVGGFANVYYWSSVETDNNFAWFLDFNNGSQYDYLKYYTYRVRAVRAF